MTFWETVERGEYLMIPLALLLIVCICIWWVRAAKLSKYNKSYSNLMHRLRDLMVEGDLENARQLCELSASPGARVLEAGVRLVGHSISDVKAGMNDVSTVEKTKMAKGAGWLKAIAVISPLMSLCGTLIGIVDRLRWLGENPQTDMAALCHAISPTIVTTVAGLGVGIFALLALGCLEGTITKSSLKIEELALDLTDLLNEPS